MSGETSVRVNQDKILENLHSYLIANHRDKDFVKLLIEGYCSGISSLWVYSKWLQTQPQEVSKPDEPQDIPALPRHDYQWFKSTVESIVRWDGEEGEVKSFEEFISLIQFFQNIPEYLERVPFAPIF
jgi:hypothetical protein